MLLTYLDWSFDLQCSLSVIIVVRVVPESRACLLGWLVGWFVSSFVSNLYFIHSFSWLVSSAWLDCVTDSCMHRQSG